MNKNVINEAKAKLNLFGCDHIIRGNGEIYATCGLSGIINHCEHKTLLFIVDLKGLICILIHLMRLTT